MNNPFYKLNEVLNKLSGKQKLAEDGSWGMSEAMTDGQQFVDYVMSFYGPGGVYDMDVEHDDVVKAIELYKKTTDIPFDGDTVDRENVRDILIDRFGYEFPVNEAACDEETQTEDSGLKRMQELAAIKPAHVVDEAEVEEGNEFSGELAAAKATGKKEFKVDGKTYPVKEGAMKDAMHHDAERMERAAFCDKYGNEEWVGEFWDNIMGDINESTVMEGEHAVRELVLFADNDADLYRQSYEPIIKNLQRKVAKGVYDVALAQKLWGYHADRAAKSFTQRHGHGTPWNRMFSPENRRAAAVEFEKAAREEIGAEDMAESQTDDAVHRFQDKQTAEKMRRLNNPRDYFEAVLKDSTPVSEGDDVLESLRAVLEADEGRPYVVVHARKGKTEVTAGSSYEAVKKAAAKWGMKNTAGIDAYLADVKHAAVDEDSTTVASPTNPIRLYNVNGMAEGLDTDKRAHLDSLISDYRDATDPGAYYSDIDDYPEPADVIAQIRSEFGDKIADTVQNGPGMHYPRPNHTGGRDPIDPGFNKSPRVTKSGKVNRQDVNFLKKNIQGRVGDHTRPNLPEQDMAEGKEAKMPMDFSKAIKHVVDPDQKEEVTKYQVTGRLDPKKFKKKFLKKRFPEVDFTDTEQAEKVAEAAHSRQYNGDGSGDAHAGIPFESDTSSSGGSITRKGGVTRHSAGSRYSAMDAETGPDDVKVRVAGRGRGRPVADKAPEYTKMNDPFGRVGTAPKGKRGTVVKGKNTVDDNSELEEHGGGIASKPGQSWQSMRPTKRSWQTMKEEGAKPDFLDMDKDGDKTEPMKKAVADKKKAPKELDEKATSKQQQKFMGMVRAAQTGDKPASKEVADVAKTMKKSDVRDFAATKHRGLPERVKEENVMKIDNTAGAKESQTQPGSNKPGMEFGGGIYEAFNTQVESIIRQRVSESLSVNVSQNTDDNGTPSKNVTVTATGEDADRLAQILSLAGMTGGVQPTVAPEVATDPVEKMPLSFDVRDFCPVCDCAPCECGTQDDEISFELDEADVTVSDNEPDWPTNQETSDDALQYSGGLNKPKSTGQATAPVISGQVDRLRSVAESTTDIERSLFKTWKNYRG